MTGNGVLAAGDVTATGGSAAVTLLAILLFGVSLVLAVLVTYHFVQGYRRTGRRPMLLLAVGLFLLTAAPMFIRLVAGNADVMAGDARRLLVALIELCGLLTVLYVVYDL